MTTIDPRARINRRALECPDTRSFQAPARIPLPGPHSGVTMQVDRTEGAVVYLRRSSVSPAPAQSAPHRP